MIRIELLREVKRMWVCWIEGLICRLTDIHRDGDRQSEVSDLTFSNLPFPPPRDHWSSAFTFSSASNVKGWCLISRSNLTREKEMGRRFDLSTQKLLAHVRDGMWAMWPSKNARSPRRHGIYREKIALMYIHTSGLTRRRGRYLLRSTFSSTESGLVVLFSVQPMIYKERGGFDVSAQAEAPAGMGKKCDEIALF